MVKYVIIYSIVMIILAVIGNISFKDTLEKRQEQSKRMDKEHLLKEKIENSLRERVDVTKRRKIETELNQAGFNFAYSEYTIFRILSAIIFGLIFGIVLKNILLAVIFVVLGFFIPHQIVLFIKNKRVTIMEKQVGSLMAMIIKRYEMSKDMNQALRATAVEFEGEEPLYSELSKTITEIELGATIPDSLNRFAERIDNKYMKRFASYYEVASSVGTEDLRSNLLNQALLQYEESNEVKGELEKEISGPVTDAYIMVAAVPLLGLYQAFTNEDYIHFYRNVTMGKVSLAIIVAVLLAVVWFIHNKLGASIE